MKAFPASVQDEVGYALYLAQRGGKHVSAKPLKGLGPGVLEVVSDHRGDTFRAVYTVRLADRVFVLHAFQKKSKHGIATPQADIELIKRRLKQAVELSQAKE
ncbi:MAG: type II toxin-antitoxin system RelE/ParE family toxin [Vicinamibacterales bacterium]